MEPVNLEKPAADPGLWPLDPSVIFLNHGSFGSCPLEVLHRQQEWRMRLERQPIRFFVRDLEAELDEARHQLALFIGTEAGSLVPVPNATTGINSVLRSLQFHSGDELVVTSYEYNACRNALEFVAHRSGAKVVVVDLPFPFQNTADLIQPIAGALTGRTRLLLVDHVSSQTGVVMPLAEIIGECRKRNIEVLVDGAHAPGMIPLEIDNLGPTFYTGNCHKWLCAPKGAAFLYVHPHRQEQIRPLTISHGANSPRTDRSRFLIEFGWTGTGDPTAFLCVPFAIEFLQSLVPGGWPDIMSRNRSLAMAGRQILCDALDLPLPCPNEHMGSLASVSLPDAEQVTAPKSPLYLDPLQDELVAKAGIEVPVVPWPAPPKRLLRISAQLYNSLPQYRKLAEALQSRVRVD